MFFFVDGLDGFYFSLIKFIFLVWRVLEDL